MPTKAPSRPHKSPIPSRRDQKFSKIKRLVPILSTITLLIAGCGGVNLSQTAGSNPLIVRAARASVDTNTRDQLSATLPAGASATVNWSITGGDNDPSIGQGAVDAHGFYTPPAMLSRDAITVDLTATLASDAAVSANYQITVTPGFVQSLTPQNATLAPGGTVRVTGEIAEVNGGTIQWALAPSANGSSSPYGSQFGTISNSQCIHSPRSYTYCSAFYTAPSSFAGNSASLYVVASLANDANSVAALHVLLNREGFNSSALQNQAAQEGTVQLGSSGGNANDYDSSQDENGDRYVNDCCGGTLGSLVQDGNDNLYILSNNHVLAE